jgi:hypothetical protein
MILVVRQRRVLVAKVAGSTNWGVHGKSSAYQIKFYARLSGQDGERLQSDGEPLQVAD